MRHIIRLLLVLAAACGVGLGPSCAAGEVFRRVFKADGWQVPLSVAGCASMAVRQAEVSGTALEVSTLDKSCISRRDLVEQTFRSDGTLTIDSRLFRIVDATRYDRHGTTVMFRVDLAPVPTTGLGGLTAAVLRFYYVASMPGGGFDLRIEQFGEPELPDWAKHY